MREAARAAIYVVTKADECGRRQQVPLRCLTSTNGVTFKTANFVLT